MVGVVEVDDQTPLLAAEVRALGGVQEVAPATVCTPAGGGVAEREEDPAPVGIEPQERQLKVGPGHGEAGHSERHEAREPAAGMGEVEGIVFEQLHVGYSAPGGIVGEVREAGEGRSVGRVQRTLWVAPEQRIAAVSPTVPRYPSTPRIPHLCVQLASAAPIVGQVQEARRHPVTVSRGTAILGAMLDQITSVAGFDTAALRWDAEAYPMRLWQADPTVWSEEHVPELADRLGWLDLHEAMRPRVPELTSLAAGLVDDGILDVVVCGMGGSSLAPDVFTQVFGSAPTFPKVTVLDSTHPGAVTAVDGAIDTDRSAFVISSKSGTTLETLSFFRYFWDRTGEDGSRFIAITDPGSPLESLGEERGFRAVVTAPSDVGGRYSALTPFGLVPAALMGVDLDALLDAAAGLAAISGGDAADDPAIALGLAWGAHAGNGHDKLTFRTSPSLRSFPSWLEQLVAESLGKNGKGLVPIADEPALEEYGHDRVFVDYVLAGEGLGPAPDDLPSVRFELPDRAALAAEMLRAEVATAVAGEVIGVHPFDQPDVERAKQLAREAMGGGGEGDTVEPVPVTGDTFRVRLERFLDRLEPGGYVSVQAYVPPGPSAVAAAERFRQIVGDRHRTATTFGYGPRFLHSTGQLHKGGPDGGLYIQVVDRSGEDVAVPETDYTFGGLIAAQADGDYGALREVDRPVLRVDVTDGGMAALVEALG